MNVVHVLAINALALATGSVLADEAPRAPVLNDRSAGELVPAGEAGTVDDLRAAWQPRSTSTVSRAGVKSEVLRAHAKGNLVPSGQGEYAQTDPVAMAQGE